MSLKLINPLPSTLLTTEFIEPINSNQLDVLINTAQFNNTNDKIKLFTLQKHIHHNQLKVHYQHAHSCSLKIGRIYSNGPSLQNLNKSYRSYLIGNDSVELDLSNSYPSVLLSILKLQDKLDYTKLEHYVKHRELHLNELKDINVSPSDAKDVFLRIIHNGKLKDWCRDNDIDYHSDSLIFIKQFQKEMKLIIKKIYKKK